MSRLPSQSLDQLPGDPFKWDLSTPQADDESLVAPPSTDWRASWGDNHQVTIQRSSRFRFATTPFISSARHELLRLAEEFSLSDKTPTEPSPATSLTPAIVLAGHQPELFHPGVWFKNFALHSFSQAVGQAGVNLVIDNDLNQGMSVRVPQLSNGDARFATVDVDAKPLTPLPHEQYTNGDLDLIRSFPKRLRPAIGPSESPLVADEIWDDVVAAVETNERLPIAIARARHRLEYQNGSRTLEVPLSHLCDTVSFWTFLTELIASAESLQTIYNDELHKYRARYRVRSKTHPVPELKTIGDDIELPFWTWSNGSPERRPLFVRRTGTESHDLMDGTDVVARLSGPIEKQVEQLSELRHEGRKIRPRALMTTFYARVVLSDWFIHGIGGGKYDRMTDAIIARVLESPAPKFGVATATIRLVPRDSTKPAALETLQESHLQLRNALFHPEKLSPPTTNNQLIVWKQLVQDKQKLIADTSCDRRQRHFAIEKVNQQLREFVLTEEAKWQRIKINAESQIRSERLTHSREYSFCLFSSATLLPKLLDLSAWTP